MRALITVPAIIAFALGVGFGANPALAGSRVINVEPAADNMQRPTTEADFKKYHGFMYDLSEYAGRKDVDLIEENLKKQLDMVENAGLSPRALEFFHTVPIIASDGDCNELGAAWACYGRGMPTRSNRRGTQGATVWSHDKQAWTNPDIVALAADSGVGVILLQPSMNQHIEDPILLHEFLHAYHARLMPNGYQNLGIKGAFADAKSKDIMEKKAYTMFNAQEFFAITASIFLAGKDSVHEPKTRDTLREKMPDYYKYLVDLFGFDPDPSKTPVAESKPADIAPTTQSEPVPN
jgi:hypothetical protein